MHKLEQLKEMLCEELEEYGSKDKLDMGGLDIVDKLAHAIKNIDKILMSEGGYSEGIYYNRGVYGDSRDYSRGEYSRGDYSTRGRKRDSMGRYSRANDMMVNELREMMDDAPDEHTRMELERFIHKMEQR